MARKPNKKNIKQKVSNRTKSVKAITPITDSIKTLLLFDHDGTLCDTNPNAFESLRYAFVFAINKLKLPIPTDFDLDNLYVGAKGITEKSLIRQFCYKYGVPYDLSEDFEKYVYYGRVKWYENMRDCGEYVWDTYYPDAHQLVELCSATPNLSCALVTGNPLAVAEIRLSNSIRSLFTAKEGFLKGSFGDEAMERSELISIAIKKASENWPGFSIQTDDLGYATNVIYIGDREADLFAGLHSKVRVIWCPSRTLQVVKEKASDDALSFILSMLGNRILVTNDLFSKKTLDFIGISSSDTLFSR